MMKQRPHEPHIDPKAHLSKEQLQKKLSILPIHRDARVRCIVQRQADGSRKSPRTAFLCTERGLIGDRWHHDPKRKYEEQIAIMDWYVAKEIANGQSLILFGDNLFIDCDFAHAKAGASFSVGEALLEITTEPHVGCSKFAKRFGRAALRYTCLEPQRQVRGIYARVIRSGSVAIEESLCWTS